MSSSGRDGSQEKMNGKAGGDHVCDVCTCKEILRHLTKKEVFVYRSLRDNYGH